MNNLEGGPGGQEGENHLHVETKRSFEIMQPNDPSEAETAEDATLPVVPVSQPIAPILDKRAGISNILDNPATPFLFVGGLTAAAASFSPVFGLGVLAVTGATYGYYLYSKRRDK